MRGKLNLSLWLTVALALTLVPAHARSQRAESREIEVSRSGDNDCEDLPPPPEGVPGLREFARITIRNDGTLVVKSVRLPFFGNDGYVYRLTPTGWVKNDVDRILVRSPIPVLGGYVYSITFGGSKDLCGRWSLEMTHPE